jgi:peptidoglycan/LPS O-acetylase OafA/YrhL
MISGFVILMTAANGNLKSFAVSRIVRLYPAFWACCTITFALTLLIGAPRFSAGFGQYLVNMTMMNEFIGVPSIDGVYWTLFIEMRFYALVAIILFFRRIRQAQLFLILWLVASIALEIVRIDRLRILLVVDYSTYFIAGATYFLIWSQGLSLTRIAMIAVSFCLAVVQAQHGIKGFESHYHVQLSSSILAAIIAMLYIVMLLIALKRTGYFGRQRWIVAGALTYPFYLLHQNIGYMVFNKAYPAINPHILLGSTIIAVLALSYAVHVLIEKRYGPPMKKALNNFFDSMQRLAKSSPT